MQARQCCQLRTHTQSRRTSHLAKSVFLLALDLLRRVHPVPLQLELVFQGLHFDRCYDQFQRNFRDLRYIPSCQQRADSPKPTANGPQNWGHSTTHSLQRTTVTVRQKQRSLLQQLLLLLPLLPSLLLLLLLLHTHTYKNTGRCPNNYRHN